MSVSPTNSFNSIQITDVTASNSSYGKTENHGSNLILDFLRRFSLKPETGNEDPSKSLKKNKRNAPSDEDSGNNKRPRIDYVHSDESKKRTLDYITRNSSNKTQCYKNLNQVDISHECSKVKIVDAPLIVLKHQNRSARNINKYRPNLAQQVNKFTSVISKVTQKNPKILQHSDVHLNTFFEGAKKLTQMSEKEVANDINKLCMTEDTIFTKVVKQENESSLLNDNVFCLNMGCTDKLINFFIENLDVCEFLLTVKQFCTRPDVFRFMSVFFSEYDSQHLLPIANGKDKVQFDFPMTFVHKPLYEIIKSYNRFFVQQVWPLGTKTIFGISVIDFANDNLSSVERYVVSLLFQKDETMTLKTLVAKLTYISVLSTYQFYMLKDF